MFQTGWGWSESSEIHICMQKNVKMVEIVAFSKTQDCNLLVILYIQVCCSALWVAHSEVETESAAECDTKLTFSSEITSLTEGNGDIHSRSLSPWNWTWVNSWMNLWINDWMSKNRSNSDKCLISLVAVFVDSGQTRTETESPGRSGRPSAVPAFVPVPSRDRRTNTTWTQSPSTRTFWSWPHTMAGAATKHRSALWRSAAPVFEPRPIRSEAQETEMFRNKRS